LGQVIVANKAKRVVLSFIAVVCALAASSVRVSAEEQQSCPDMSEHQKVLNEGIEYSESGRTTHSFGNQEFRADMIPWDSVIGSRKPELDLYAPPRLSDQFVQFRQPFLPPLQGDSKQLAEKDSETLPLRTEDEIQAAEAYALKCEEWRSYTSAKRLYERILLVREKGTDKKALASTLEDLARVYIMLGAPETESAGAALPESVHWTGIRGRSEVYVYSLLLSGLNSNHHGADESSEDSSIRAQNWNIAAKMYSRVLEVQDEGYVNIGSLLNLAALKEWQGKGDVWALYVKAMTTQKKVDFDQLATTERVFGGYGSGAKYEYEHHHYLPAERENAARVAALDYCIRNSRFDLLRTLEQDLVFHRSWPAVSNAILAYVNHDRDDDALRLFRQVMSQNSSPKKAWPDPKSLSTDTIVTMLPRLSAGDRHSLESYVSNNVEFDVLPALIVALQRAGRNDWALSLYHEMNGRQNSKANANHTSVLCLLKFGNFYLMQRSLPEYFNTMNQVMSVIEDSNDIQLSTKNDLLAEIDRVLSRESSNHMSIAQPVVARAHSLSERYRKRIEKHECIEMADRLDKTGSRLEDQAQYAEAEKMYRESLAIKQKNLEQDDPDLTFALDNMARICADQKRHVDAQRFYEQELVRYRKNPRQQDREYAAMLERYGDMLAHANQTAKADQIYAEARAFYNKTVARN
jgi:Tetratricopeptide repeat